MRRTAEYACKNRYELTMARALFLYKSDGKIDPIVDEVDKDRLPEGDVLVSVMYSGLNYKDGLAITGRGKVIRGEYPFIPGIDFVGTVTESDSDSFQPGDVVIGTGWGLGETRWGGYSQLQRVRAEWLVSLPHALPPADSMVLGTAGFTAMLSLMALEDSGVDPSSGEIVVTGASGGVGSIAVAALAASGYTVVASTGSDDAHDYLRRLGASRVIDRSELGDGPRAPLDSARWAGAVDTVGGLTLAAIISQLDRHGGVAACGLAGGHELHTTVYPFVLRGVKLLGIDSNTCPMDRRREAWERIADLLAPDVLRRVKSDTISLFDLPGFSERILAGEIRGRVIVDVNL